MLDSRGSVGVFESRYIYSVDITVPIRPTLHARDHFNFPIIPKNRHKSRKNYWRGQKKSGVTRDRRVGRIDTVPPNQALREEQFQRLARGVAFSPWL